MRSLLRSTSSLRIAGPLRTAGCAVLLAGALAACGGDDDTATGSATGSPSAPADGATLVVDAYDELKFDKEQYSASAGEITFEYVNDGAIEHTLLVDGYEDDMKLVVKGKGDTDEGSVSLEPGEYELYCDVAGHRAGGMEATLTVE